MNHLVLILLAVCFAGALVTAAVGIICDKMGAFGLALLFLLGAITVIAADSAIYAWNHP